MNNLYFLLVLLFVSLISSCDNKYRRTDEESKNLFLDIERINTVVSEKNTIADTFRFQALQELINFYTFKTDSLNKIIRPEIKNQTKMSSVLSDSIIRLEELYYQYFDIRNAAIYNYLLANRKSKENFLGLIYLIVDNKIPVILIDSIFQQYPAELQLSAQGKLFFNKIAERKNAELMSNYLLSILKFKFQTLQGEIISLEDIENKYLVLDFWASWCAPCRYENRFMVKEKHTILGNKDISLVAISLDTDKRKWINAAMMDNLNYLTVCDFKGLHSPIYKELKILSIPYNLVIDKKGNILARNLWRNDLKQFIESLN